MGQSWDGGDVAFSPDTWRAVLRVLKPGAHLVAMGGTRTYHRLVSAVEVAGFEIRDTLTWLYGQGFPKSHDVSKAIDKAARAVREQVPVMDDAECRAAMPMVWLV
jgi:site-specific DNA-methyltransferase (adenine-specific)